MKLLPMVITFVVIFLLLAITEVLWRMKVIRGESARKLVHIGAGVFVAFWPYFLSWPEIQLLGLGGVMLVLVADHAKFFHVGYDIKRRTWGEIFFPIMVVIGATIAPANLVFTVAMLHLSLADGFAALVGKKYGLFHQYRIRNYTKTLAGSLTFWLTSLILVAGAVVLSTEGLSVATLPLIVWLPLAATAVENISPWGLDNLLVPLLIIVVLQAAGVH